MVIESHISVKANVTGPVVEQMRPGDWAQLKAIYLEGIATGHATFEIESPSWEAWDAAHLSFARLVARDDQTISGWAALSPISRRQAYAGVAEVSVYVAATNRNAGIGRALLDALIAESERNGIWTLQAAVFPENEATIALHRRCGFREVGCRERIGKLNGEWRDTILLERRSALIGTGMK
ncbi:MAG TPA: GNAT family N-acetyltransferase [Pyrinomonadaceae bacterium]|nr:GNAT family N-acetyltransferase [Pyrinomonadaceae bacterium]